MSLKTPFFSIFSDGACSAFGGCEMGYFGVLKQIQIRIDFSLTRKKEG